MAFLLAIVTYLDRVCIAIAAPFIMQDLGLTLVQMSTVFGAFTLAYSLFEVPSGWLGDVIGPRRVLTRIVLWWSAFTMLTGAAQGLGRWSHPVPVRRRRGWRVSERRAELLAVVPGRERGMANGVLFFGSRLGGAITAPIALLLIQQWGWRRRFVVFGAFGLVWATAWYRSYRDRPAEHPDVDRDELAWIQQDGVQRQHPTPTPQTPDHAVAALLASPNLYAICAMYFTFGYGLYFYFTWLPTYLVQELGFSLTRFLARCGGFFASLPFLLAGAANLAGGWCTDALARTRVWHRTRALGFTAFSTCAVLILASILVPTPVAKAVLLALALASADFALSACWAVCLDVAPNHAGVVTGFMNTFGNLGGLVGPMVVG